MLTEIMVKCVCSGGKDSCFNLMHCVAEGHELVALANLRPADKGKSTCHFSVKLSMIVLLKCVICSSSVRLKETLICVII